MSKVIIVCGCDRIGKDSLINSIKYTLNNTNIIHSCVPENNSSIFNFYYNGIIHKTLDSYYKNINVIHNRSMYGEYVYGTKYRNEDKNYIKDIILKLESGQLKTFIKDNELFLILLTSDNIDLLVNNDDGLSFSSKKKDREDELNLFNEIFNLSTIKNKLKIKVNDGSKFRSKSDIFNEAINFINS